MRARPRASRRGVEDALPLTVQQAQSNGSGSLTNSPSRKSVGGLSSRTFRSNKQHGNLLRARLLVSLSKHKGLSKWVGLILAVLGTIGWFRSSFGNHRDGSPRSITSSSSRSLHRLARRAAVRALSPSHKHFHEFDISSYALGGMFKYIGNGSYRQVFLAKLPTENVIFKEANWDNGHESGFHTDEYEFMRQDMVVGESFTSNPRFVDIYGFCALSMFSEFMPFGDAEVMAQTIFDRHNPPSIKEGGELVIFNNLTGTEKLEYALQMADAVSYLHNYPGGVIVHDDIQMPQFLLTADKRIKLNDFNRAEVMLFDEENNEYCKYRNNPGHGDWRSPEEYYDKPLDEKIDIYSLGNNFYALLTGMGPFYEEAHSDGVIKKVKAGMKPYIDQRFLERSFAEKKLAEIMVLCWEYDPVKRPDINTLVQVLREAVEENLRLQPV
ncbi:predicted protein [Phaeodactylum tricornutum CCAP 1055/1]|uniref:Protein kinase domain-containing protein n=2 Tax=Phaeodactylum tricornutum TaxID=2850 RepID=B7GAW5_PHATC|nr:predicted protein [Phaeodactylum tricornutum CCAP 1055/1]EEC44441.1 predicted protein [Phaeodactylum tricornutum CCAP 1055/1]|eukprot:XP_002184263.1 predicted protein [Phaeodactylum tricornutum CCAP 1055/1]